MTQQFQPQKATQETRMHTSTDMYMHEHVHTHTQTHTREAIKKWGK